MGCEDGLAEPGGGMEPEETGEGFCVGGKGVIPGAELGSIKGPVAGVIVVSVEGGLVGGLGLDAVDPGGEAVERGYAA